MCIKEMQNMKSTMIDKKNIITYGDFVRMVDDICKQSIKLDLDIVGRTKAAFAQYQECVKGKLFLYESKKAPIPFDNISTQELEQQIIAILKLYLGGKITDSITNTCALWNGDLINSAIVLTPEENNTLYRTRNTDKELTAPEKLFHAPFELRNSVGTARFSILGFPGLYLTRNLYTAWEESRQSDVFKASFKGVPQSYYEAAEIDGANEFRIMCRIAFPMIVNTFWTVFLIHAITFWNDYQTIVLYLPSWPTLSYGLFKLSTSVIQGLNTVPMRMAGCMFLVIPVLIIYMIFNRRLLGNVSMGGVKE